MNKQASASLVGDSLTEREREKKRERRRERRKRT